MCGQFEHSKETTAVGLLELGHTVTLYEALDALGGAPEHTYGLDRHASGREEVEALLAPAMACNRLRLFLSTRVGESVAWDAVTGEADAVVLASGVWSVPGLGWKDEGLVESAMDFLQAARTDPDYSLSGGVAILAGGDAAMDAARVAWLAGASKVIIVFEGDRSAMHWHMAEEWFAEDRVHLMIRTRPVAVRKNEAGDVCGLDVVPVDAEAGYTLEVERVINAQGLVPGAWAGGLVAEGAEGVFAAGGLVNGGASVQRCLAEGKAVARDVDAWLKDV